MGNFFLGILTAMVLLYFVSWHPFGRTSRERAKTAAKHSQIGSFQQAIQALRNDTGRFPTEEEGLQSLRQPTAARGWNGPYLQAEVPADPWGMPYRYRLLPPGCPAIE